MDMGHSIECNEGAHIRSRFVFQAPERLRDDNVRRFRDPFGLEIFVKLAECLRTHGYQVSEPEPGKICDAAFIVRFDGFTIWAFLGVGPHAGTIEYSIFTGVGREWSGKVSRQFACDEWTRLCTLIDQILRQDLGYASVLWLTSHDFEERWKKDPL
jgi:hypothetical protein